MTKFFKITFSVDLLGLSKDVPVFEKLKCGSYKLFKYVQDCETDHKYRIVHRT